jgi:hypothetical protein
VAELVGFLRLYSDHVMDKYGFAELLARAADLLERLAEPEPVGATDDELIKTYCDARRAFYFEAAEGRSDQEDRKAATIAGLRAVLARWGPND